MHTGKTIPTNQIKRKKFELPLFEDNNIQLAMQCHLNLIRSLTLQVKAIESSILQQIQDEPKYYYLNTIPGVGEVLAETIILETGDIRRFKSPGNFASYCRLVESQRLSNGKVKGKNNRKNGNRYLAWAFIEAANFCIQHCAKAKRFYDKKSKATNTIVARKDLAHKLARACFWMMKKGEPFNEKLIFS